MLIQQENIMEPISHFVKNQIALAPFTTMGLGGPAQYLIECFDEEMVKESLLWAQERNLPVLILGGGSNTVISDQGVLGLILVMKQRGISIETKNGELCLTACAGEPWDKFVALCVSLRLAGVECLSGIPGLVGSTPVQNVGAYGQEVADVISKVKVLDRKNLQVQILTKDECEFGYRTSLFKKHPSRFVVLSVTFALQYDGAPTIHYAELQRALSSPHPSLTHTREVVLMLRRKKSMVIEASDENQRSVGSFFLNPIVSMEQSRQILTQVLQAQWIQEEKEFPRYSVSQNRIKLSAAWLIERAGIPKGFCMGQFGVSTRHTLCLVHYGHGQTQGLIELAKYVQQRVYATFGVWLCPEPVFWGFEHHPFREEKIAEDTARNCS